MDSKTEQILLGSLCGDSSIDKDNRFRLTHCIKQKEYLLYKISFLNNFAKLFTSEFISNSGFSKGKQYISTSSSPSMVYYQYRSLFYPNDKKLITFKILKRLDWFGIAIWFCDDGWYDYRKKMINLSNKIGSHNDIEFYFNQLGLTPKNYKYYFCFNQRDTSHLISKIRQYILKMPKCIHYKIGLDKKKINEAVTKNKEFYRNFYWSHRSRLLKQKMEYHYKNRTEILEKRREYYKNNKLIILRKKKINRFKNLEKYRLMTKLRFKQKHKIYI